MASTQQSVLSILLFGLILTNATIATRSPQHHPQPHRPPGRTTYFDTVNSALRDVQTLQATYSRYSSPGSGSNLTSLTHPHISSDWTLFTTAAQLASLRYFPDKFKQEFLATMNNVLRGAREKSASLYHQTRHLEAEGIPPDPLPENYQYCVNDTGRILTGIMKHEPWALQMFDSCGKPGPSITEGRTTWVGNYDQCRSVSVPADPKTYSSAFKGAYLNQDLNIHAGPYQTVQIHWGLCFPNTCSWGQIWMLFNDTLTALKAKETSVGLPTVLTNPREFTGATYASIVIISYIGALIIAATIYDVFVVQMPKWEAEKRKKIQDEWKKMSAKNGTLPTNAEVESGVIIENGAHEKQNGAHGNQNGAHAKQNGERTPLIDKPAPQATVRHSKPIKALLAFSAYTNTSKFLNTSQPQGSLGAIHGIRFLSMSWVLLGHTFAFVGSYVANQATFYKNITQTWTFDAIMNAFSSVDTFFTLSGFLTAYLTLREMNKIKTWKVNWGLFYFHRFWRLTPPYMLTLTLTLGLTQYLGSGPTWPNVMPQDKQNCEDYWWTNLLYVNNAAYPMDKSCFGHSWYLANDMQFFVLSPFMIVPFFFSTFAGLFVSSVFLLTNWTVSGVMSQNKGWGAQPGGGDYMDDYYVKPWHRIGPYVVGIAVGALLAARKLPRLNKLTNTVGWMLATATGLAVVYGLRGDISGKHPGSTEVHALYNAVSRSAWGACVCWVIVACKEGYGGPVNALLSWSPFVSLGRLTYMAYLVHPTILYAHYANLGQTIIMNDFNVIVLYLGVVFLVNMVAFVLMLGLESPMIGLEKALLPERKRD